LEKGARLAAGRHLQTVSRLNHLFMFGEGKSKPAEYACPGHVAEPVVTDIADRILKTKPAP
jgi:hypothetical protein